MMGLQKLSVTSTHKRQTGLSERKFHIIEELGVYDSFAGSKFHLGCVDADSSVKFPIAVRLGDI